MFSFLKPHSVGGSDTLDLGLPSQEVVTLWIDSKRVSSWASQWQDPKGGGRREVCACFACSQRCSAGNMSAKVFTSQHAVCKPDCRIATSSWTQVWAVTSLTSPWVKWKPPLNPKTQTSKGNRRVVAGSGKTPPISVRTSSQHLAGACGKTQDPLAMS